MESGQVVLRWAIVQYSIWRNRYGELNLSIHQALIGNVGELTGPDMDVGVFVLCFEEDFNYHLGEGKDDEIWLAHESWNHDGDTRKSTGMLAR
jgi:hypothetical protein